MRLPQRLQAIPEQMRHLLRLFPTLRGLSRPHTPPKGTASYLQAPFPRCYKVFQCCQVNGPYSSVASLSSRPTTPLG